MEKEKLNQLQFENKNLYQQLVFADAKHAVIVGLVGAAIFGLININIKIVTTNWLHILIAVHTIMFFITMCFSLKAFFPNVNKLNTNRKCNIYFFGDIKRIKNASEYMEILEDTENKNNECEQIAEQNIILSRILDYKYFKFKQAVHCCISSFFLPYIILYLVYCIVNKIKKEKQI